MRVDGFPNKTNIVDLTGTKTSGDGASGSVSPSALNAAETFEPTGDVQGLLNALQQTPVIRPEVIADVADRLNAGELNTPKAKEETVNAILGSTLPNA